MCTGSPGQVGSWHRPAGATHQLWHDHHTNAHCRTICHSSKSPSQPQILCAPASAYLASRLPRRKELLPLSLAPGAPTPLPPTFLPALLSLIIHPMPRRPSSSSQVMGSALVLQQGWASPAQGRLPSELRLGRASFVRAGRAGPRVSSSTGPPQLGTSAVEGHRGLNQRADHRQRALVVLGCC